MKVLSLHRYPVKSMLGESLLRLDLDERGCVGDRLWSVRTAAGKIGSGKDTRRFASVAGLLDLRAGAYDAGIVVALPDGTRWSVEDPELAARISAHVGQPVTLARESTVMHFDDGPVSLIGTASVAAIAAARGEPVDVARFRANIVVDTSEPFAEDAWVGQRLRAGTAELVVTMTSVRCVMVDMATADLPAQPGNLTTVGRLNGANLGVIAAVERPGRITVGDTIAVSAAATGG